MSSEACLGAFAAYVSCMLIPRTQLMYCYMHYSATTPPRHIVKLAIQDTYRYHTHTQVLHISGVKGVKQLAPITFRFLYAVAKVHAYLLYTHAQISLKLQVERLHYMPCQFV